MSSIYIFYHNEDLDGKCAGAIAKKYFYDRDISVYMMPFNHRQKFPYDILTQKPICYMLDVSVEPPEELINISQQCDFYIIDHHKTVIDALSSHSIQGTLNKNKAACELTWKHFFPNKPLPAVVELLSLYDCWNKHGTSYWEEVILPFQYGMRLEEWDPLYYREKWNTFFESSQDFIEQKVNDGKKLLKYLEILNKEYIVKNACECRFMGLKTIACNSPIKNMDILCSLVDDDVDIILYFSLDKKLNYNVSLYSKRDYINVSVIAQKFGGGGHSSAAGFNARSILLDTNGNLNFS